MRLRSVAPVRPPRAPRPVAVAGDGPPPPPPARRRCSRSRPSRPSASPSSTGTTSGRAASTAAPSSGSPPAPGRRRAPPSAPTARSSPSRAELDGNLDVFVVPAAGGVPKRLTWHPSRDIVQGFTPDGKAVLFSSPREAFNNRHDQLYTVPVEGGVETKLPIPHAARAVFSPDGKTIAYTPNRPMHLQWKRYRGGTVSRIWLYDVATHAVVKVPQPEGRCNDLTPAWVGETLYLTSDRDGEFNVYAFDAKAKSLAKVTSHADFPVLNAASAAGKIVYEQAGLLHLLDPATKKASTLPITVNADLLETRPRWAKGAKWVRDASLSPSGARVALEFRGEIVTVPAEKGDPRYLTATPGAHERGPAWSPDGKEIAYVSDESGEYELVVAPQDGKGTPKRIKVPGSGFYDRLAWSPDWKKIALTDNSWSLWVVDLATGKATKVASERLYAPQKTLKPSWSPDSRWVAYTLARTDLRPDAPRLRRRRGEVVPADGRSLRRLRPGLRQGRQADLVPRLDGRGPGAELVLAQQPGRPRHARHLRRHAEGRDAVAPREGERRGEGRDREGRRQEGRDEGRGRRRQGATSGKAGKDAKKAEPKKVDPVVIDREGFARRIVDLPVPPAEISALSSPNAGEVWFLRDADGKTALQKWDTKSRKAETIAPEVDDYEVSFDGKKLLTRVKESWSVGPAGKKGDGEAGRRRREAEARRRPGARRPARRVAADLRRGLADQPRLLLRPRHARARLEGDEGEVRAVPAAPLLPRRPDAPHPVDVQRAGRRPPPDLRRRRSRRGHAGPRRPPRRRLRGRQRPLPLQEGLRRPELEPRAARPALRAGRRGEGGRVPPRRERQGPRAPREPLRPLRGDRRKDRRDHRRPVAGRQGLAHRQRRPRRRTRRPCATATGSRGTSRRSRRRRAGASPTSTSRTRPASATPTSSATSTRRRGRTRSSSTSGSTAAGASPTTTSRRSGASRSPGGRSATART